MEIVESIVMDAKTKQQNLLPIIRQHGNQCMAYSTLQDGLEYEIVEGVGFIAYLSFQHFFWSRKGVKIVLADPMCEEGSYRQLATHFIEKFTDVIFIQVSDVFAKVLNDLGYEVNQFGIETDLFIQDFNLKGKYKSKLRQWSNKCKREKLEVKEKDLDSDAETIADIKALSNEWLSRKGGHEFSMLTRPLCLKAEADVRYFQVFKDNKLVGFAVFDPIYVEGEVVGYYHNIDRISRNAPHGTGVYLILQAMEVFKNEGKNMISLGMSPLYGIKRTEYRYNDFLHEALFFAYKHLEFLYPFKGNAGHKKKFNGSTKRVFFSSTSGNSLWQLLLALKAVKLF